MPVQGKDRAFEAASNMSIRDYFAAAALPRAQAEFYTNRDEWVNYGDLARHCYGIADAMLKERKK